MSGRGLRWGIVVFALGLACALAGADTGPLTAGRKLSFRDRWDVAFHSSDVIMLARVLRVDSLPDSVVAKVVLEPEEYVKGGLDGDQIETWVYAGTPDERALHGVLRGLAGVDTVGVIAFLSRDEKGWRIRGFGADVFPAGALVLRQREWASLLTRLRIVRDDLTLDRVLARATCVVEIAPAGEPGAYRVLDRLQGSAPEIVKIRAAVLPGRTWPRVVALVRVQPTLYEPVPYTWFPDLPEIPADAPADSAVALVRARLRAVAGQ
jgi:hypothetical protein